MPPTLTSLSPSTKPAGSSDFYLSLDGAGFISGFLDPIGVYANGLLIATVTPSSDTNALVHIPASAVAGSGVYAVHVRVNGVDSNDLTFVVTDSVPTLSAVDPAGVMAGSTATISVVGSGFVSSSVINVDGSPVTTTFINGTHLETTSGFVFSGPGVVRTITVVTPGVGESNGLSLPANNPVPTLTSFSPNATAVDDADFTLTINGTGFNAATVAGFGPAFTPHTVTLLSSTSIQISVLQSELQSCVGTAGVVKVTNPTPGGGAAQNDVAPNVVAFTVTNATPVISNYSPTSVIAGSGAISVSVFGSWFAPIGSVSVHWNSTVITDFLFHDSSRLTFSVTAAMLASPGSVTMTVVNDAPGGGTSNAAVFTIIAGVPSLNSLNPSSVLANSTTTVHLLGGGFSTNHTVRVNGSVITSTWVSTSDISVSLTPSIVPTAGDYTIFVTNNDSGGGGVSATRHITATNPAPTLSSLSTSTKVVGDAAFTLTLTGTGFVNGSTFGTVAGSARTTIFVSSTQIQIGIKASDLAQSGVLAIGVTTVTPGGGSSSTLNLTVNNPAPVATSLDISSVVVGSPDTTVTITGSGFIPTSQAKISGTNIATTYVSTNQTRAVVPTSNLATVGSVTITVVNSTPGGGSATCPAIAVVNPVPAITSLSPNQASSGDASFTLTINGLGFKSGGVSAASVNGAARTTTFVSSTQLTITINASDITAAGTLSITVTNTPAGGTSASASLFIGASNPTPTITSVTPSSVNAGSAAPSIAIVGTNFVAASVVRWEGADRVTTFVNSTHLTAQLQSNDVGVPGSYVVTVFNSAPGGGPSTGSAFTVVAVNPAPQVTSVSPTSSLAGASSLTVTVNGVNLMSTSTVSVMDANGAQYSPAVTFVSSVKLTFTMPTAAMVTAGSVTVTVTNPTPGGGSASKTYTVQAGNPIPSITSVSPSAVAVGSGAATLTITGTGFVASSQVKAGATNLTTTFGSSTSLTAALTSGLAAVAGNLSITVVNPPAGGGTSNAFTFAVQQPTNPIPTITALSPNQIPRGNSAFLLSVLGTGFVPLSAVTLAGNSRTTAYVDPLRLDVNALAADVQLSAGGLGSIDPNAHTEVLSHNAANLRTYQAGNQLAPAITIGPNDTQTGFHSPDDGVWEFSAQATKTIRLEPGKVTI